MRVLFALPHSRDDRLGSPKSVLRLGAALRRRGVEVAYLFAEDRPALLPGPRGRELVFPLVVALAARARPAHDVLDVAAAGGVAWAYLRRLLVRPPAVVARVLGLETTAWAATRRFGRLTLRYRLWSERVRLPLVARSVRAADRVVCLSHADADAVAAQGWQPPERIAAIPPGVDQTLFEAPAPGQRCGALYVGSWTVRKGADVLVRAFTLVRQTHCNATLTLAGTWQPPGRVLKDFPFPVREHVRVLPPLDETELAACYRRHAVLLMPSRYEGFGMVALEALASGTPVVATPTGGAPELIASGVNGYLVPANDPRALAQAWLAVAGDTARYSSLARAARESARPYTWERAAEQTAALYSGLGQ